MLCDARVMERRRSYAGRALLPVVVLLAVSGCGGASPGGSASCAGIVERAGITYLPVGLRRPVATTGRVLSASQPACDDMPGDNDPGEPASLVRVRALRGVAPRDALATVGRPGGPGSRYVVYVRLALVRKADGAPDALRRLLHR